MLLRQDNTDICLNVMPTNDILIVSTPNKCFQKNVIRIILELRGDHFQLHICKICLRKSVLKQVLYCKS